MAEIKELPKGYVPFNPSIHKPQDLGLGEKGQLSTEFVSTMDAPNGGVWNIPTVWFDEDGVGKHFDEQTAGRLAYEYEKQRTKEGQFPRFNDIDSAVKTAIERSKQGGATHQPLFELFQDIK